MGTPPTAGDRSWSMANMPLPTCLVHSQTWPGNPLTALSPAYCILSTLPGSSLEHPKDSVTGAAEGPPVAYQAAHTFHPKYPKQQRRGAEQQTANTNSTFWLEIAHKLYVLVSKKCLLFYCNNAQWLILTHHLFTTDALRCRQCPVIPENPSAWGHTPGNVCPV